MIGSSRRWLAFSLLATVLMGSAAGCTKKNPEAKEPRVTKRDKTAKGAGIGAAAGAVIAATVGEREADEILAGAAIGAGIGAGVGAYMDAQEEKLAQIPGTSVERAGKNTLLVRFESDMLFDFNSSTLKHDVRQALDESAQVLLEYPKTAIVVQGHTDAVGTEPYNQELSERRARAVSAYLIGKGISPERIATVGYGESMPVASNETSSQRAMNRRVELLLKAKAR